jgi:hypothetical protein
MNVRYFFIADQVKSKEIRIDYCPTGILVADYYRKPLQGILFQQLRDMIMGNTEIALPTNTAPPTDTASDTPRMTDKPDRIPVGSGIQECVGK